MRSAEATRSSHVGERETSMQIGMIGLGRMGANMVRRLLQGGHRCVVFDRSSAAVQELTREAAIGASSLADLVEKLERPRAIWMMIPGAFVEQLIADLLPHLEPGDILIDGGNSDFNDTNRRSKELRDAGLLFIGTGVSGGEEGALKGPSIMPGGHKEAWPHVKDILQSIAAKVEDGTPCCDWVGEDGAGHYVKMVHNGIEYGDMQLICEAYFLLKHAVGLSNDELHRVFQAWNESELESYLIEITRDIFTVKDRQTGNDLIDMILDTAQQKGTGKWMSQHALDLGVPTTLITEAVYARCLSAQKDARVRAADVLTGSGEDFSGDRQTFIDDVRQALYASKLVSYAQGFVQLDAAADEFGWKLNNGSIALLWRGGCIIRSRFLGDIKAAFDKNADLENLLLDDFFKQAIDAAQPSWRRVVAAAVTLGLPVPGFASALSYYDGYRQARLPANLLQAQRDYFGAHTYERIDKPRGETFHTDWIRERTL